MITRRKLLVAFAPAVLALPLAALAQQARKIRRIGYVSMVSPAVDKEWVDAFREGLRELGYVEGENIILEQRHAPYQADKVREYAADLARGQVEVLLVYASSELSAFKTMGLPVVMANHPDPVGTGVIASLARPGGNITGLMDGHSDLAPKRLELLKEIVPSASRVGAIYNPTTPHAVVQLEFVRAAAPKLGIRILAVEIRSPDEIESVFGRIGKERADAVFLIPDQTWLAGQLKRVADLALKWRLPAVGTIRQMAENGILLSYGTSFRNQWRRAATYVDKILKGAKPADLPVEHPTKFELVVNMKTAKAIGVKVPRSVLLRADEVIE